MSGNKCAKGLKGCLLCTANNDFIFRVYHDDDEFTDYDIIHSDMEITIEDEDAFIYKRDDGSFYIDYSPQTLGKDL